MTAERDREWRLVSGGLDRLRRRKAPKPPLTAEELAVFEATRDELGPLVEGLQPIEGISLRANLERLREVAKGLLP